MIKKLKNLYKRIVLKKTREELELEYLVENGMKIGKNCHLYSTSSIDGAWPWLITIGDDVTISTNVTILAHDASTNVVGCHTKLGKVTIGNNVFVGTGSTILCNVKIGNNIVIGAGSVVSSDLESDTVYAGVPAKKVCSIQEYEEKNRKKLLERPYFSEEKEWYKWISATEEEKQYMIKALDDGVGYI